MFSELSIFNSMFIHDNKKDSKKSEFSLIGKDLGIARMVMRIIDVVTGIEFRINVKHPIVYCDWKINK